MVKNEIDIIETFIRYHHSLLDGMIILDNGSTDGTKDIILKLIKEKLPVYLLFDDNPSYDQAEITTGLLYATIKQFSPDFILPLDVDEFLTTYSDKNIRLILDNELDDKTLYYMSWVTYVPTEGDIDEEINPLKRITHRRVKQHNYDEKILIPTQIAKRYKIKIKQGNHEVEGLESTSIRKKKLNNVNLAHFPIRSADQVKSKYLVGWLANLARSQQVLFDWYYYYNILKSNNKITKQDLKKMASYYDVPDKSQHIDVVEDPLDLSLVSDFSLKYTSGNINYIYNVLNYAEILARKYSQLLNSKSNKNNSSLELNLYNDQIILQVIRDFILIDGWLSTKEAVGLYKVARSINGNNIVICEIGSWFGKSSYILAKAIESKRDSCLYCIDPFDGTGDDQSKVIYKQKQDSLNGSVLKKFNDNMKKLGVFNVIN